MKTVAVMALVTMLGGMAIGAHAETSPPTRVVSIPRLVSSISTGHKWGEVRGGIGCAFLQTPLIWGKAPAQVSESGLLRAARNELKAEGFAIAGDPDDPFGKTVQSDIVIGGTVTAIQGDFCTSRLGGDATIKGTASVEIDWQVYSSIERRVVAKAHESGAGSSDFDGDGFRIALSKAIGESLKHFVQSAEFPNTPAPTTEAAAIKPGSQSALALTGATSAKSMTIGDAVGSVVLILSGGGHGSGFLVSSDGYVMTADHVVGTDKYVKVRWSDGLEGVGEVIRTDRRRDVALVKVDPRGRAPLALHRQSPQPGDTVFAIGAPIDPKLQGTVTRGVVSANRIMDGFSYIQSDVTVDPGNSGGPLLDEKGQVLGFTDKGLRSAEAPTGLNFFVPIDDALRFLSAEPR